MADRRIWANYDHGKASLLYRHRNKHCLLTGSFTPSIIIRSYGDRLRRETVRNHTVLFSMSTLFTSTKDLSSISRDFYEAIPICWMLHTIPNITYLSVLLLFFIHMHLLHCKCKFAFYIFILTVLICFFFSVIFLSYIFYALSSSYYFLNFFFPFYHLTLSSTFSHFSFLQIIRLIHFIFTYQTSHNVFSFSSLTLRNLSN